MSKTVHVITPRPPVRALVIAAVASLVGAVLLVLALGNDWHPVAVILSALLLAAGLLLAVAAFIAPSRQAVTLTIDDDGYRVNGGGKESSGQWADVSRLTQSADGSRLTIHHGPERRNHLVFQGSDPSQIRRVATDIRRQLQRFSA